jgi:predicted nucleotidyltransferase
MPTTPSATETSSPFEELLVDLVRSGVDFAVVGGVAVAFNGFIRATDDVDILVHEAPDNIGKLLARLRVWGEGWARELRVEDFAPQEGSIRVIEDFDLDIFTRMRGHALEEFRPRLRHVEASGVRIPYLAAEDLILLKQDSWREKDKLDVAALRKTLGR